MDDWFTNSSGALTPVILTLFLADPGVLDTGNGGIR